MKTARVVMLLLLTMPITLSLASCAGMTRWALMSETRSGKNAKTVTELAKEVQGRRDAGETLGAALRQAAVSNPNPEVITALLGAGADVNARDKDGMTPLMFAAVHNPNPEVASTLLAAGADVNARDKDGMTALMFACVRNQTPGVVPTLLGAGADINAQNKDGWTALMYAARYNPNPEVVSALLISGADAKMLNVEGKTAFDYANGNKRLEGTDAYNALKNAQ